MCLTASDFVGKVSRSLMMCVLLRRAFRYVPTFPNRRLAAQTGERFPPVWKPFAPAILLLAFLPAYVAAAIAHFISLEVCHFIDMLGRLGFIATVWHGAFVAVIGMKTVVDVASEVSGTVKPRTSANEYTTRKPFRPVVAIGSAGIGRNVVVTVGAVGSGPNVDAYADLSLHFGSAYCEADSSNSSYREIFKFLHGHPLCYL